MSSEPSASLSPRVPTTSPEGAVVETSQATALGGATSPTGSHAAPATAEHKMPAWPAELLVTVSGVRGVVGRSMTPATVALFAQAYAEMLIDGAAASGEVRSSPLTVAVGRDSRPSGEMVTGAAMAGLLAGGVRVMDLGLVSTPATAIMTRRLGCAGGLVITASHNPIEWNGLKFLRPGGAALNPLWATSLRQRAERGPQPGVPATAILGVAESFRELVAWAGERLVQLEDLLPLLPDRRAAIEHVRSVLASVGDTAAIARRGFKVVVDAVNGAGWLEAPHLLNELGTIPIALNVTPDGRFPRPPEPLPEHLAGLAEAVVRHKADVGFALDPDADRLVLVDETGRCLSEEMTLALAAELALARHPGPLAANLSTSRMIDDLAAAAGVPVWRTPVGEAHVHDAMLANDCVLGGEGNGGVINLAVGPTRDALLGMAMVLELMAHRGEPLSRLADRLPAYTMVKTKFAYQADRLARLTEATSEYFVANEPGTRLNTTDGLRIDLPRGWVHLRASNTEPIMRVIAEARDAPTARDLVQSVTDLANRLL